MNTPQTRRMFLSTGLATGVGLGLAGGLASGLAAGGGRALAALGSGLGEPGADPKAGGEAAGKGGGLKILILGGTGFLGPAVLDSARARGHTVTLFNRGRTEKRKPGQFEDVEKLYGNRDPNLTADEKDPESPKGLKALEGRAWDAVVDTSGYVPRVVKASAELLGPKVKHYTFISTISVYAKNDTPGADESAEVGTMADPTIETMGAQSENYGPLKALCEQAAEAAMPGRVLNIRPGFIVGPNDPTDRFTYWPVRATKGGKMLCPGDGTDPVQFIDVRDLAEFIIRGIEKNTTGVFNVTGPKESLPFKEVVGACLRASGLDTTPTWVPIDFLQDQGVALGAELPIFIPPRGEVAGFHTRSVAKAVAAGLTFRTADDTCRAILAWWPKELERRKTVTAQMMDEAAKAGKPAPKMADPDKLRAGMTREREREIVAAWEAKEKEGKGVGG